MLEVAARAIAGAAREEGVGMARRTWLHALAALLAAGRLGAQTVSVSNLDESTFRYAVTEERRSIFAANLALGPEERERFWKIYDEYTKEREPLDKERFALMQRYAQSYVTIGDDSAMALALAYGRLQISDVQLRLKYAETLRKKMSGRVAARFFQIDDYVTTAMRMKLLSGIPLVAPAQ
jgi:hypothetical protein